MGDSEYLAQFSAEEFRHLRTTQMIVEYWDVGMELEDIRHMLDDFVDEFEVVLEQYEEKNGHPAERSGSEIKQSLIVLPAEKK